jgi:hypothetical protein
VSPPAETGTVPDVLAGDVASHLDVVPFLYPDFHTPLLRHLQTRNNMKLVKFVTVYRKEQYSRYGCIDIIVLKEITKILLATSKLKYHTIMMSATNLDW